MLAARTKLGLALAAVGAAACVGAIPAEAASTGAGVVVGSGTISPGLTNTPTLQHVSFTGTLVAAGKGGKNGKYACSFTGASSIKETLNKGQGTAHGTCSGPGTVTSNVSYTRTASNVRLAGTATGAISGSITGDCDFAPTSAPQVKSYQLQCVLAIK
jgi:hypothetical protein